jgi:dCMP deaminase
MVIFGLTGKYAAGKGTVADYLVANGFVYHSLSDMLREELAERCIEESRPALLKLGNELREAEGPGALASRLARHLTSPLELVDSIRNPAEVDVLRQLPGFTLIGVDADPRLRFERLRTRNRQGDPMEWDTFKALEARETKSANPNAQQLAATFDLADVTVNNDGSLDELQAQVRTLLRDVIE